MEPLLKWLGGKTHLVDHIRRFAARGYSRYVEPMAGGAAVFFGMEPRRAVLSDSNPWLMTAYEGVRQQPDQVIRELAKLEYDKETYYLVRRQQPDPGDVVECAVWVLYLNRTCYNGLWRMSAKGEFNSPMGKYVNPKICDPERIRACSLMLQGVELHVGDFEEVCGGVVQADDLVYFDPPYIPVSKTANFTDFTAGGFPMADQLRLRDFARRLQLRGAHVVLSNSDTPEARELYKNWTLEIVPARRAINSKGGKRGAVKELLIY